MTSRPKEVKQSKAMRGKIIDYWDEALLCSLESSTSHADPDLSYLDNEIENRILEELLSKLAENHHRCMDIGAGYGRFAGLFHRLYAQAILLEPASKIFERLDGLWGTVPGIECLNSDFESYEDSAGFDLLFTSGVLYLYDDKMLKNFLQKAISMLKNNGVLIIRDFVSIPAKKVKSKYVKNGFCYYRSLKYWDAISKNLAVSLVEVRRSKPPLFWLRNRYSLSILRLLGIKKIYRHQIITNTAIRFGNKGIDLGSVQPVFIVLKRS